MPATYEIHIDDPFGNPLEVISDFVSLDYARKENNFAPLEVILTNQGLWPRSFFRQDLKLSVWRTNPGDAAARLDGGTVYFLRDWEFYTDADLSRKIRLVGYDANYLWDGREVEYASGSAQADQTAAADNMMKAIISQNAGATATDTTRSLADYLSIQANLTLAPSTTKGFARRKVLTVLQELANESLQQGTYLVFDTVYTSARTLEFRTYTGQRGNNRGSTSGNQLTFSEPSGTLINGSLSEYHSAETNVVYAAGQGTGSARTIVQVKTDALVNASPWARREKMLDCRNVSTTAAITAEGRAELYADRPRLVLIGRLVENENTLYGRDYEFGDLVSAEYEGVTMDAHINFVHVTVTAGVEKLDVQIRGEL